MSAHGRSDTRTPASYRTTRPATYRTTNPAWEAGTAAGPSVHSTAGRYGAPPRVVAPTPDLVPAQHDHDHGAAAWAGRPLSAEPRRTVRAQYVDSDCLIGVRDLDRPGLLQARSVDAGGHPRVMLPVLRRLWTAAGRDTVRLAARLLAHDWHYLDPGIPAISAAASASPTAARVAAGGDQPVVHGRRVIAGVGITHTPFGLDTTDTTDTSAGGDPVGSDPVMVVPLAHLDLLDAAWLYLLDPAGDSVAVHSGDGGLVSHHLLNT
ncbi:hypothetical protein Dvina_51585 [Dactylosporangium vinaceum]|uniref:Uncharacterized protein n=1 Tax=Dactylosporangium vinaceum TaxID=53362 RepID=A0ABV5M2H7_9ACTN|nr:hypothetical protein [Dactylosporangium vinaceum]UAB96290.1 hypothetical protein Dvina_51585 [Dactylosporangium vinaceum]